MERSLTKRKWRGQRPLARSMEKTKREKGGTLTLFNLATQIPPDSVRIIDAADGHIDIRTDAIKIFCHTVETGCNFLSDHLFLSLSSYDELRNIDEKKNIFLKGTHQKIWKLLENDINMDHSYRSSINKFEWF
ncbi:hypothetical protein YC2023_036202 [Brassica napus]